MPGGIAHHASSVRAPRSLVVRAGLARTFGGLAAFVVVTFLCGGIYILEDAFANPRDLGATAVISAAFIITLAAMLLFYLGKPGKRPPTASHGRALGSESPAAPAFDPAIGAARHNNLRNNFDYQRFYVDHSRIRP